MATSRRTVAATFHAMGLSHHGDYARYHELLNRAVWASSDTVQIRPLLLLPYMDRSNSQLIFGIDEILEPRRGSRVGQ